MSVTLCLPNVPTVNLQRLARALGVRDDLPRRELIAALVAAMDGGR